MIDIPVTIIFRIEDGDNVSRDELLKFWNDFISPKVSNGIIDHIGDFDSEIVMEHTKEKQND
jgi:hypothetical protein